MSQSVPLYLVELADSCAAFFERILGPCPQENLKISWEPSLRAYGENRQGRIRIRCQEEQLPHYAAHEIAHLWINRATRPHWNEWWQIEAAAEFLSLHFLSAFYPLQLCAAVQENVGRYILVSELLLESATLGSEPPSSSLAKDAISYLLGVLAYEAGCGRSIGQPNGNDALMFDFDHSRVVASPFGSALRGVASARELRLLLSPTKNCEGVFGIIRDVCLDEVLGLEIALKQLESFRSGACP